MPSWKRIYTGTQAHQAALVQAFLENHNIQSIILNKQDSAYLWGHFEIHVPAEKVLQAVRLIQSEITFGETA